MYYNDRPDVIEANDLAKLLHLTTSHLADGRVILHADFELAGAKQIAEPEGLRLHMTDGATHALFTPEETSPAWHEGEEGDGDRWLQAPGDRWLPKAPEENADESEQDVQTSEEETEGEPEVEAGSAGEEESSTETEGEAPKRRGRRATKAAEESSAGAEAEITAGAEGEGSDADSNI